MRGSERNEPRQTVATFFLNRRKSRRKADTISIILYKFFNINLDERPGRQTASSGPALSRRQRNQTDNQGEFPYINFLGWALSVCFH